MSLDQADKLAAKTLSAIGAGPANPLKDERKAWTDIEQAAAAAIATARNTRAPRRGG